MDGWMEVKGEGVSHIGCSRDLYSDMVEVREPQARRVGREGGLTGGTCPTLCVPPSSQ
jgi:hypothetical protein